MKALVVYFTESGCTRRVAQTIAEATLGGKRFPSSASDSAIRSWLESLAL